MAKRFKEGELSAAYDRGIEDLLKKYRSGEIDFLQYQARSYSLINETIDSLVKKNNVNLSKRLRMWYNHQLFYDWAHHDPLIKELEIMKVKTSKDYGNFVEYDSKLRFIGEHLSRQISD